MPSRTRMSPDARRSQLLDLGAQLFADRPYDEVLIEQVAEIAGVSRGLLYHYFPTKRDFFAELLRRESATMLEQTAPAPGLPMLEQLLNGIDGYLQHCQAHRAGVIAVYRGAASADPEVRAIIQQGIEVQSRRIFAAVIPGAEPHPLLGIAVRSWLEFLRAACHEWLLSQNVTRTEIRDLAASALIGAVSALPAQARPPAVAELLRS